MKATQTKVKSSKLELVLGLISGPNRPIYPIFCDMLHKQVHIFTLPTTQASRFHKHSLVPHAMELEPKRIYKLTLNKPTLAPNWPKLDASNLFFQMASTHNNLQQSTHQKVSPKR